MKEHACNECGVLFCKLTEPSLPPKYCSKSCRQRASRQKTKPWRRRTESQREKMSVYAKEYNQRPEVKAKHSIQVADRERWEGVSLACMGEEDKAKTVAIYMERDRLNKDLGHAGYHVDHILPKALGGDHIWFNMQILTAQENLSKNAQFRAKDKDLYQQRIAQLFI